MIPFPKDFQDFLKLLDHRKVKYLVVGGYALGYHGYVRATGDLDLFIEVSDINADRLDVAFKEFGFSHDSIKALFLEKGQMVRIGRPGAGQILSLSLKSFILGLKLSRC